jgi:hypothetical protein
MRRWTGREVLKEKKRRMKEEKENKEYKYLDDSLIRKNNIKVNKKCTIRIKSGGIVCAGAMSCGPSGQTIDRRH